MRSAIAGILVAAGIGGIVASSLAPASAQQSTAPAGKLHSQGAAPAAAAARELPKDATTRTRLMGEAGGPGPASAMAGSAGLVDTKTGKSSVEKAQAE